MEQNENHASTQPFKQSLLVSVAILIAGVSIAGAIIYNGKNAPVVKDTQGQQAEFPAADISKVKTEGEPFIGRADAPVTIAYWYDYQCPFCQRHEAQTVAAIVKDYVNTGKAKLVFKDYAFLGPDSQTIGKYSRAVWEVAPDKFYAWHDNMFANQGQENSGWATKDTLHTLTRAVLGEEMTKQVESLVLTKGDEYQKEMDEDKKEGTDMGVRGTPAMIIGNVLIPGAYPYAQTQPAIEAALKNK
jgi:protein-disulfide isomerase